MTENWSHTFMHGIVSITLMLLLPSWYLTQTMEVSLHKIG